MTKHSAWRAAFLTALANFKLSRADVTAAEVRATLVHLVAPTTPDDHDGFPLEREEVANDAGRDVVRSLTEALAFVLDWVDAVRRGDAGATNRLQAAHALAFTAAEEFPLGSPPQFEYRARAALQAIQEVQGLGDVPRAVQALQAVPVPYRRLEPRLRFVSSRPAALADDVSEPYVVKVAIDVDGRAWNAVEGWNHDRHA